MFPPVFPNLMESDAVKALVGAPPNARVYEAEAAPSAVAPYVVWALVGGAPEASLDAAPTTDQTTIQVDCYAATVGARTALVFAVRDALEKYAEMTGVIADERTTTEPRLYRLGLQFDYWLFR